jgi:hypothetical protein
MDVTVKEFNVKMEVKNSGIEFEVREPNGGRHKGDLVLSKAGLTWCEGKKHKQNGKIIKWNDFIQWVESQ